MLDLSNVTLLSHSRQNRFWGDSLRYAIVDNFEVQTNLYSLENTSGVSSILRQLSGMTAGSEDWQPITFNNYDYVGLARVNSVGFAPSNDVRLKNVNISLTVFNSGNTFNLNTGFSLYSGINLTNPSFPPQLIEEFTETFSTQIAENGDYTEQQQINLRFLSGAAIGTLQNPYSMARQFASNLINSNPVIGFVDANHSGWRQKPGKRTRQETLNLIDNSISVNETFKLLAGFSGTYSINYTNSLNLAENGITSVREQARVQGLMPDSYGNYYESAKSGAQYEVNNFSFNRCNGMFIAYGGNNSYPLINKKITYGQTLNKFLDIVEYNVEYSNDPRINTLAVWEYTQEIEREDRNCTYRVSENGTVQGLTDCIPQAKFDNAISFYSGVKTGIYNRTYNFYTGFSTFANELKVVQQSETQNKIDGLVRYSKVYTDNLLYSYSGVRKMTITVADEFSTPGYNLFGVANFKTIAQKNNIPTLAHRSIDIEIFGLRGMQISGYYPVAINQVNSNVPTGNDPYIDGLTYSFNPLQNQFVLNCSWTYYQNINLNQFLL